MKKHFILFSLLLALCAGTVLADTWGSGTAAVTTKYPLPSWTAHKADTCTWVNAGGRGYPGYSYTAFDGSTKCQPFTRRHRGDSSQKATAPKANPPNVQPPIVPPQPPDEPIPVPDGCRRVKIFGVWKTICN